MALTIEEIVEDDTPSPSQERLLDAEEIEKLLSQLERPTAKMQIESLVKKIRKEASALKALESTSATKTKTTTDSTLSSEGNAAAAAPQTEPKPTAPAKANEKGPTTPAATATATKPPAPGPPAASPSAVYISIDRFLFDAGSSSDKFVTLYLPLPGVGFIQCKSKQIVCDFGNDSFDVSVLDLNGKNYRLKRDNLEHNIVPGKSKCLVKRDKVVVKLAKIKGDYGTYDFWTKLTDPNKKAKKKKGRADPSAGLMDMMKDMYDSGDDNMRKMIGETMMKQRNGELNTADTPGGLGDMGAGFGSD